MKSVVTGGAGFLGSYLCERLLEEKHEVVCLDNLVTGSETNIDSLFDYETFSFLNHDVTKNIRIEADRIYNLASMASPTYYQREPIHTFKTNVLGSMIMLENAVENDARILQASTSEVYGDPEMHPQKESYWGNVNPIGIRSCYDEGKRGAESLFFDYHRVHKTDIRIARIFNTYGPRMHPNDGRVITNFLSQALLNEPITIYGDGTQSRSFCFVEDLVEGLVKFMNLDLEFPGPLNLGNPTEFNMLELANLVIEVTNSSSPIIFEPLPQDDPKQRKPDISLAREILGWNPIVSLKTGLMATAEYLSKRL